MSIAKVTAKSTNLTTFSSAAKTSGLLVMLATVGPFTVFAPSNGSFERLGKGMMDSLLQSKESLQKILSYHIVRGKYTLADLLGMNGQELATVNGQPVTVAVKRGQVSVVDGNGGKAAVSKSDIKASNGTIHQVNAVLQPNPDVADELAADATGGIDLVIPGGGLTPLVPVTATGGWSSTWGIVLLVIFVIIIIALIWWLVTRSKTAQTALITGPNGTLIAGPNGAVATTMPAGIVA